MKRYAKGFFFITIVFVLNFLLFSCSSKPAAGPAPPMIDPRVETSVLKAEFAAQKAEDAAKKAQEAAERAENTLKKLEEETQQMGTQRWQKEGVLLHIISDSQLNLYQGSHHTLLVCVYQMKDPNTFNQMIEDSRGLSKLLECDRFDTSALSSKKLVIQPKYEVTEFLDKAEGSKYIGIVAGYYQLRKENAVYLMKIPGAEELIAMKGHRMQRTTPVIEISLYMGPQKISVMDRYEY